jgi:Fe-S cluster assembly protein SufD
MEVMEDVDVYLADFAKFERRLGERKPSKLQVIRKAAIARFAELGFPTVNDEEWRFTNVAPLAKIAFQLAPAESKAPRKDLHEMGVLTANTPGALRLRFLNGHYDRGLSSVDRAPKGALIGSLGMALADRPELVEPHLAQHAKFEDEAFVALNTAFIHDGAFVFVPRNTVVEQPIHIVYTSAARGEPTVSHPRSLIVVGENSQVTVIECFVGFEDEIYFTNAVTEIVAGASAVIDHYKVQEESKEAFHIATLNVHQDRSSNVSSHSVAIGGGLVRNEVNAVLDAEGCECTLNGLYLAGGEQLIDNHTRIDHAKPHGTSHELYKGILDGKGKGVFNGKIYVHADAQKTDAKQTNQTLLLSPDAVIDTKPQLEIFADDVKCTHGATIGQLDDNAIFYLRTRGIDLAAARSLLTYAFANDIISRIKVEPIRNQLEDVLLAKQHLPPNREAP